MEKKRDLIVLIILLIGIALYTYSVIESYSDEAVEESVLKVVEEKYKSYPSNLVKKIELVKLSKNSYVAPMIH